MSSSKPQNTATTKSHLWFKGRNPTADFILTREHPSTGIVQILLIVRGPGTVEEGKQAYPGGFHDTNAKKGDVWRAGKETAKEAALREIKEETCLEADFLAGKLRLVGTFEGNARDPRDTEEAWTYTTVFSVHLDKAESQKSEQVCSEVKGTDDASKAEWVDLASVKPDEMAFDHGKILHFSGVLKLLEQTSPEADMSLPQCGKKHKFPTVKSRQ